MTDFPHLSLSECADALLSIENPLVLMHAAPDGDTVATAGALCEIFRKLGKEPCYACADEIPEELSFLLEGCQRAVDFSGLTPVAVDVSTLASLGALNGRLTPALSVDHHVTDTHYAPYYSRPAASAGEVLYEVVRELEREGKIEITRLIAERLYASISSDTERFSRSNASQTTYAYCAELLSKGIRPADINRRLFFSKKIEVIRAEGFVGSNIKAGLGGRVSYALIPKGERCELGLSFSDFASAIDVVGALSGSDIFFVIRETDEGEYKALLRSLGRVDVSRATAPHGGTGYSLSAKCTLLADTIEAAGKILLAELATII